MTQNDNAEDILAIAANWKAAGEDVAIATVVETWGSSPRPAGSRLAITKSGKGKPSQAEQETTAPTEEISRWERFPIGDRTERSKQMG